MKVRGSHTTSYYLTEQSEKNKKYKTRSSKILNTLNFHELIIYELGSN